MLNTIIVKLDTGVIISSPIPLGIELKSQDINNTLFILKFTENGKTIELDDAYTIEVLSKFEKSQVSRLTSATIYRDYARWNFDTNYITQDEKVTNYVYVRKSGTLVTSADANAFVFKVSLSEIDRDAGRIAEVYDENYDRVFGGFEEKLQTSMEKFDEAVEAVEQAELTRQSNEVAREQSELNRVQQAEQVISQLRTTAAEAIIMGAEWHRTSSPAMTRTGHAVGLEARASLDGDYVLNDFDAMPIYREIISEVDSYGNSFVRIPKFYIKKISTSEKYSVEISKEKLKGFYLPAVFWDFENGKELDYFWYGAKKASLSADGLRLESKSGVKPLSTINIVQFRALAQSNGKGYQQNDIHAIDVLQTLFRIEFATLNSQLIHPGFTSGNTQSATTGGTDDLAASSGAMGTGGSYQFNYRGIEDPWGNVYEFIDGININELQTWVCRDAEQYVSNVFASPYETLGYINHNADGYVKEMGFDRNLPFAEFPSAVGGGASTFYSDYYYRAAGQRVALFGGHWSIGANAGLSFWFLGNGSSAASSAVGARLLKKPL